MKIIHVLILIGSLASSFSQAAVPADTESVGAGQAENARTIASAGASLPVPQLPSAANDYRVTSNWLCHPELVDDACNADLTTTIVEGHGVAGIESHSVAESPNVDCFYVYPTISEDESPNSDMIANRQELSVIKQQFARFGAVCRLYAPLYRQITLPHLRRYIATGQYLAHPSLNYDDVKDAWDTYIADYNEGRGVILIGHSQGAGLIARLITEHIQEDVIADRVISAMPIGRNIYPDENGRYPLQPCTTGSDVNCLIGYVSFRGDREPPVESRYGKTRDNGQRALCVNPARIAGDDGELKAYLARQSTLTGTERSFGKNIAVDTPFASIPGMLTAACRSNATHTWLAININANPEDNRADDIAGDVVMGGVVREEWGLHVIDIHLAMGNLITIARMQAEAWLEKRRNYRLAP